MLNLHNIFFRFLLRKKGSYQHYILEHYCLLPSDPINGHKNCSESSDALFCTLSCEDGFSFAYQPLDDYFCPFNSTDMLDYSGDLEYQYVPGSRKLDEGKYIRTL